MHGVTNIVLGLLLLLGGGGLIMAGVLAPGILLWSSWAIAGFGFAMFGTGLFQAFGGAGAVDAEEAYRHSATVRLLMQGMLTTALADGELNDEEVTTIADACEEVIHEPLDPESIRQMGDQIRKKGDAVFHEIGYEAKMLNLSARKAVVDACALVLMLDHDVDARKSAAARAVAQHLGFSETEAEAMIAQALNAIRT